jgi:ComEC/Rec2-related protein
MQKDAQSLFNQYPSVRLAFFTLPGILVYIITEQDIILLSFLMLFLLLFSLITLIFRLNLISYVSAGIAIGLYISFFAFGNKIDNPNKITPEMNGIFTGEITKILKTEKGRFINCVAEGKLDTQDLPKLEKQIIILQVVNPFNLDFVLKEGLRIFTPLKVRIPNKKVLPDEIDEIKYADAFGAGWFGKSDAGELSLKGEPNEYNIMRYDIVNSVNARIDKLFNRNTREIVKAMLTGVRSGIPTELKQAYSVSGTAHVLSISGLHVGIIAFMLYFILNFIGKPWIKFALFIILTGSFVFLTGMQPPAVRSGIMAVVFVFAITIQRKANLLNVLFFTGLIMIIIDPELIKNLGFQLSFLSILGIALFHKVIKNKLELIYPNAGKSTSYLLESVSVGLSASVAISIVISVNFGYFSFVSIVANILVVPLMMGSLIFSVLALLFSLLSIEIGALYSAVADFMISISNYLVAYFSEFKFLIFSKELSLVMSVAFPILVLYILISDKLKSFLFRSSISIIFVILLSIVFSGTKGNDKDLIIYPRRQLVATVKPLSDKMTLIYLADRKPTRYNYKDNNLLNYLLRKEGEIVMASSGKLSCSIADSVSVLKGCRHIELNKNSEELITNLLNLKTGVYKIIDLNCNE